MYQLAIAFRAHPREQTKTRLTINKLKNHFTAARKMHGSTTEKQTDFLVMMNVFINEPKEANMLINPQQHANLRYLPIDNRLFAASHAWIKVVCEDIEPLIRRGVPIVLEAWSDALPIALLRPTDMDDPLGGHTPVMWRDYPFTLGPDTVGLNHADQVTCQAPLWADPDAPHWSSGHGYRLFDYDEKPTPFLRDIMSSLQARQRTIQHTYTLVSLLHRAEALSPMSVEYGSQRHVIYRIDLTNLAKRLTLLDSDNSSQALHLATLLEKSQAWLSSLENTMPDKSL